MNTANIPLGKPDDRAGSNSPKLIVVHAMGEIIDTDDVDYQAVDWLKKIGLSAHALITPSGVVIRCRRDDQLAWHAKGYNTDSLGVEFLVPGLHTYGTFLNAIEGEWLTPAQYDAGIDLVRDWMKKHAIPAHKVTRHSEISPGRKFDPGAGFPWERFLSAL